EETQEPVGRLDVDQVDLEVTAERLFHLFGFPGPEETMIDEDAGQPVTHRLVDEGGRHRRVDSPRERTDDAVFADLGPDLLDLGLDDRVRRPGGTGATCLVEEMTQDLVAAWRVGHFGMELDAVETPLPILHG